MKIIIYSPFKIFTTVRMLWQPTGYVGKACLHCICSVFRTCYKMGTFLGTGLIKPGLVRLKLRLVRV